MDYQFKTFNFYDIKGRRLTCYGFVFNGKLTIRVLTCSKQDKFIKSKSDQIMTDLEQNDKDRFEQTFFGEYTIDGVDHLGRFFMHLLSYFFVHIKAIQQHEYITRFG